MEQTCLVSIITIVYNGEQNIERAIQSVINQTYQNIEYIIIDGGSTDQTVAIIRKFESRLAFWVSEKDAGIADAFNKGIKKATGEIIGILNSDDWYETDAVEKILKVGKNADVAYGDLQYWKDGQRDFVIKGDHTKLRREMTINHPSVFVKKACYEKYGSFDLHYRCAMDYELMIRYLVNKCVFVHVPSIMANMQWGGLSDTKWMMGCRETRAIKNNYFPATKFWNYLQFIKHVVSISVPRFIQSIGLGFVVKRYRQKKYEFRSLRY